MRIGHQTTAYELALIADEALKIDKFKSIVSTKSYTVTINGHGKTINNTNELLGYLDGVYGVKTGFTNGANRCLVTAIKRGNLDIICVVLGADTKKNRTQDSIKLIEYAFSNYEIVDVESKIIEQFDMWRNINEKSILVERGVKEYVKLNLGDIKITKLPIKKDEVNNIDINITKTIQRIEAPVEMDKKIGVLEVKIGDKIIESIDIVNIEEIRRKEVKDYFYQLFLGFGNYLCDI